MAKVGSDVQRLENLLGSILAGAGLLRESCVKYARGVPRGVLGELKNLDEHIWGVKYEIDTWEQDNPEDK